jgi:iron complex transport system ATP-binding protein
MLEIQKVCFNYKTNPVLKDISLCCAPNLTAVIGPNAAGKTTFLKCLAGILRPKGAVLIEGRPRDKWKRSDLGEMLSYLPQQSSGRALLTVFEAVLLGRLSRLSWRVADQDLELVMGILAELGLESLATKPLNELSGGQQQMVSIAQALVKQPRILLMDEPTNNLDLQRQLEVFEHLARITRERGLTSIVALHDLNFAARFADQVMVLNQGKVWAVGTPEEVLTESLLLEVYGVVAKVVRDDEGIPQIIPIRAAPKDGTKPPPLHVLPASPKHQQPTPSSTLQGVNS